MSTLSWNYYFQKTYLDENNFSEQRWEWVNFLITKSLPLESKLKTIIRIDLKQSMVCLFRGQHFSASFTYELYSLRYSITVGNVSIKYYIPICIMEHDASYHTLSVVNNTFTDHISNISSLWLSPQYHHSRLI